MENGIKDYNLVFFAGQSEFDPLKGEKSQAIIACVSMSYHLTPVTQFKFADPRWIAATSIRRIRPTTNEFLVGVNQAIKVVYLDFNSFREIMSFDTCHTGILILKRHGR